MGSSSGGARLVHEEPRCNLASALLTRGSKGALLASWPECVTQIPPIVGADIPRATSSVDIAKEPDKKKKEYERVHICPVVGSQARKAPSAQRKPVLYSFRLKRAKGGGGGGEKDYLSRRRLWAVQRWIIQHCYPEGWPCFWQHVSVLPK
ncbi:hypothetical protein LY78DRAFT_296553 [Colletotrichum sublineola]|nr:hypothetical protein LY78DRAFT_296553 [Colletotrichum sublineola]